MNRLNVSINNLDMWIAILNRLRFKKASREWPVILGGWLVLAGWMVPGFLVRAGYAQEPGRPVYVNPVIPGDHPDPTLTRVGAYYYTSGSSFNVTPRIYRSTDLVHWEIVGRPVSASWSLYGDVPAGGVWGGHMVYYQGLYWHFFGRGTGDRAMYFVTAHRPEGPWSMPVRMNVPPGVPGLGVDNSIFIDEDGRWFLLSKNGPQNNYIVELGPDGQPTGVVYDLTWINPDSAGNPYGWAEGPVMWKYQGYYYYSFAQHLVGNQYVMRSDTLSDDPADWEGPRLLFETVPDRYQRVFRNPNHCSPAVTADDGTHWMICHAYDQSGPGEEWRALGRQGLLVEVRYEEGWPVARFPTTEPVEGPALPDSGIPWAVPRSDFFDRSRLAVHWSLLGYTPEETYDLTERPGWLRLTPKGGRTFPPTPGRNTVLQAAAERAYSLMTRVDFDPATSSDEAGLWIINGPETLQARLCVTRSSEGERVVAFRFDTLAHSTPLPSEEPVWLKLEREGHELTASFSLDGASWAPVAEKVNVARLDREQPASESGYDFNAFTGNQQGLYVLGNTPAYFDLYIYRDAYSRIPAQHPTNYNGVITSRNGLPAHANYLAGIHDGEWAMYAGVEFGAPGSDYSRIPRQVVVTASSATGGGVVEVWVDALDTGQKIAEVPIESTGSWDVYQDFTAEVVPVSGRHDVFLRFRGNPTETLFRIRSLLFEGQLTETATGTGAAVRSLLVTHYPNPVRDDVTFLVSLPRTGPVRLVLYNALGQQVATLMDTVRPAGRYPLRFTIKHLSPGLYFYQLTTKDQVVTGQLIVISR